MADTGGRVAIVIPTLNEEAHIAGVLDALATQARDDVAEILVVDGGSSDATRTIVGEIAAIDPRIRLIDNPGRLQSAAVNLAARVADSAVTLLIRADAHAEYPAGFVSALIAAHERTGAESVVNQLHSVGETCFQRAVAAVSNSRFGTGGSLHRIGGASGFVDHGHHALFDRAWFQRVGGYDESFVANEDAEYDARLRAGGGRIWFTDDAPITYLPRSSPRALARQYYRYGMGRARTRRKHGEPLRLRQAIPPILLTALVVGLAAALVWPPALIIPAAYAAGVVLATAILVRRTRDACVLGALVGLPVMHLCWGWGFLREAVAGR